MPREDNAAMLASRIVTRFAEQGPPRLTPTMERFLADVAANIGEDGRRLIAALSGPDPRPAEIAPQRRPATRSPPGSSARCSATRSARTSSGPA